MASRHEPNQPRPGIFPETAWLVVTHCSAAVELRRQAAQTEFYRAYWRPVFALVCRHGFNPGEAEDLTENFLLHFLKSGALGRAREEKGKLRDFIAASLDHYLINYRARMKAQKRGGQFLHVGLDDPQVGQVPAENMELFYKNGAASQTDALAFLREALAELEAEYARKGRARLFRALKEALLRPGKNAGEFFCNSCLFLKNRHPFKKNRRPFFCDGYPFF